MYNHCGILEILCELTVAYTSEQNGVSERTNGTLVEKARIMLVEKKCSKIYGVSAFAHRGERKIRCKMFAMCVLLDIVQIVSGFGILVNIQFLFLVEVVFDNKNNTKNYILRWKRHG